MPCSSYDFVEFFHITAGRPEKPLPDLSEDDFNDRRQQFLAGNELTAEMLYLHDENLFNKRMFVQRNRINGLEEEVNSALEFSSKKSFENYDMKQRSIIRLMHQPVSGATTIANVVMWKFHKEYPCIKVKEAKGEDIVGKELRKLISDVYIKAQKPVLVLFDNVADYLAITRFMSELANFHAAPKLVVLLVERVVRQEDSGTGSGRTQILKMELSPEEEKRFAKLYEEAGGDMKLIKKSETDIREILNDCENKKTPFLFGVLHCLDYLKVNEIVTVLLENSTQTTKDLLYFASLSKHYINYPVNLAIAAHLLDLSPTQDEPTEVLKKLGLHQHLLILQKVKGAYNFSPVVCVAEKIMEICSTKQSDDEGECEDNGRSKEQRQVVWFVDQLCGMADTIGLQSCLGNLVTQLTTFKRDSNDQFSHLMKSLYECSKDDKDDEQSLDTLKDLIHKLASSFPSQKGHILIHLARLLTYKEKSYDESLILVRTVLELETSETFSDTRVTDATLLGMSSHLLNCKIDQLSNESNPIEFKQVISYALNSIELSKRSQAKTGYLHESGEVVHKAHPFIGEIQAQRRLLKAFFDLECHGDGREFIRKIQDLPAVLEINGDILQKIFALESMYNRGQLELGSYSSKEQLTLDRTKKEFMQRYSHCSVKELLEVSVKTGFQFAWVAFDYYMSLPCIRAPDDTESDLTNEEENSGAKSRVTMWDRTWNVSNLPREKKKTLLSNLLNCPSKMAKNYFEICVLLILFKGPTDFDRAQKVTLEWRKRFESDHLAHFMHGTLMLVKYLKLPVGDMATNAKERLLRNATDSLSICKEMMTCKNRQHKKPGYYRLRLFITSSGEPLNIIKYMPKKNTHEEEKEHIRKNNGRRFTGIVDEDRRLICFELNSWRLNLPSQDENNAEKMDDMVRKKSRVSFFLAMAYSGLTPIDIKEEPHLNN
ncbi:hypothetical protein BOX15_Mlig000249g2 [Macrostomum lignano]|uniref:Uncharacterized protein n=1 Tax=Macrostomum lignano TaxID=282301 RepID=A0A267GZ62_9PLAT|nr:hypothetical protein BOX15_Mlig000249g2 [Macrostomum lignano]